MNGFRAWAEIDLNALLWNIKKIQRLISPGSRIMAVVKANAYGHGAVEVSRFLEKNGIKDFAVACFSEGEELRRAGITGNIMILGYTPPVLAKELARLNLTQTVVDEAYGEALKACGIPLPVYIKVDTGMHRIGIPWEEKEKILSYYREPLFLVKGIFSHLCAADSEKPEDKAYTEEQIRHFKEVLTYLSFHGVFPGDAHILASAGILNRPEASFSMVRPGILLYGEDSVPEPHFLHEIKKKPALSLKTRLTSVRVLKDGETAGYGRAYKAAGKRRIAAASIGYADGLPGSFLHGQVLVRGTFAPVIGKICMDQILLDVTNIPLASPGDVVTIVGQDGGKCQSAKEAANMAGQITNEFLSGLGRRIERIYKE